MMSIKDFQGKNPSDQQRDKDSSNICQRNFLVVSKNLGKIFCGMIRQKFSFLEGLSLDISGVKQMFHKNSNMVVVVWWSRAALTFQNLDDLP